MLSGVSLTSWGEGVSLAMVGHPFSDGITIKIPYGVDVFLHRPTSHPIFVLLGWLKLNLSVEIGIGRSMLVVAVISVDVYPFLAFPDLTCQLQDTGIGVFWLHCATAGFSQALFDLGVFLKLSLIEKKQWIV